MAKVAKTPALNTNSSFWLDTTMFNPDGETSSITKKLKLLAYKRAISNFVKILTKTDNYVVKFNTGADSYTDGKTIVISSKLNENNFDVTVGLALHEASHVLLTNFNTLKNRGLVDDLCTAIGAPGLEMRRDVLFKIHNIVEDRYIDDYVYTTAPGYRGYYQSLYDYYFRSEKLAKLLKTPEKRKETVDNYITQLLNIVGLEFDLNCMPGMPEIVKELDLPNISRCSTTIDRMKVAVNIYAIILKYVNAAKIADQNNQQNTPEPQPKPAPKQRKQEKEQGQDEDEDENLDLGPDSSSESNDENETEQNDLSESGESNEDEQSVRSNDTNEDDEEDEDSEDENTLSDKELQEAEELLKAAQDAVAGEVDKGPAASSGLDKEINILDQADAEIHMSDVDVNPSFRNNFYSGKISVKCLLVKNFTKEIATSRMFSCFSTSYDHSSTISAVAKGTSLGTLLAKRMQVRNEEKNTISNRLNSGKIFNRHIALLGADIENIFYKIKTDKFKKSIIHISIDASGSMSGDRFTNSIITATAIAKACTYLNGVDCVISFRSQQDRMPLMVIGYNSKKDHFSKIADVFPYITCNSSTPEGLCYDAYKAFIIEMGGNDVDKYVINLSDGEPCFRLDSKNNYSGEIGVNHTRKVWNEILKGGVIGLSYFISDYEKISDDFKRMYGSNAKSIQTGNIVQLASTINEMLMSRNAMTSIFSE